MKHDANFLDNMVGSENLENRFESNKELKVINERKLYWYIERKCFLDKRKYLNILRNGLKRIDVVLINTLKVEYNIICIFNVKLFIII